MCGIAGFVGSGDRALLERMTGALSHRGPDGSGHWQEPGGDVFLGHRRLSIVDLSGGAQPMWTADGQLGVTFNGEIYNHAELRRELRGLGAEFLTDHSDTEVLLHAYRYWGESMVDRLNGMWAFVLFDRPRRRLFGSRDRFGKKPLYYFHEGRDFAFASELTALRAHPSCPSSPSPLSLRKYFAYGYIPAPRSILERVWKLPGGHSFTLDLANGALRTWRYWRYELEPDPALAEPGRLPSLCEEIRATLEGAVRRRLMSDVPLGVFLSGGLDSSAIAALASRHLPDGQLHTFSVGFEEASFDETPYARRMAAHLGSQHSEDRLDLDTSASLLPEIVGRLDEPIGDGSLLPTYLLCRFARSKVTVALGGDGGDELFAGYDPFRALGPAAIYHRWIPKKLHTSIRWLAGRIPVSHRNLSLDFKLKRTLAGLSYPAPFWNAVWMSPLEPPDLDALLGSHCPVEELYSESLAVWEECRQPNLIDRSLQWWTQLYLQDGILAKVDRASMLNSLEARSPFLDLEVANLARRIPHTLKLRDGSTKWILKQALTPLVPADILQRPKKGFGMPIGRWLREGRFEPDPLPAPLDPLFTRRKLDAHLQGRADERLFLWSAWMLGRWLQT
jgi:asparagine synthase (glutamine-hydrolysing)